MDDSNANSKVTFTFRSLNAFVKSIIKEIKRLDDKINKLEQNAIIISEREEVDNNE